MKRLMITIGMLTLTAVHAETALALSTNCASGKQIYGSGWQTGKSFRADFLDSNVNGDEWLVIIRARNNTGSVKSATVVEAAGCKFGPIQLNNGVTRTKNCIEEEHTPTGRYTLIAKKEGGTGVEWNVRICQQ